MFLCRARAARGRAPTTTASSAAASMGPATAPRHPVSSHAWHAAVYGPATQHIRHHATRTELMVGPVAVCTNRRGAQPSVGGVRDARLQGPAKRRGRQEGQEEGQRQEGRQELRPPPILHTTTIIIDLVIPPHHTSLHPMTCCRPAGGRGREHGRGELHRHHQRRRREARIQQLASPDCIDGLSPTHCVQQQQK